MAKQIPLSSAISRILTQKLASFPKPKDGKDGRDGKAGRDGKDGKDGITTIVKEHVFMDPPEGEHATKKEHEDLEARFEALEREMRMLAGSIQARLIGGGGYPVSLHDDIAKNKEEIDELAANLEALIQQLIAQGSSTQEILSTVITTIEANEKQTRLLATRAEEAWETGIDINDINEDEL